MKFCFRVPKNNAVGAKRVNMGWRRACLDSVDSAALADQHPGFGLRSSFKICASSWKSTRAGVVTWIELRYNTSPHFYHPKLRCTVLHRVRILYFCGFFYGMN